MLRWAVIFAVIGIIAGVLGFGGVAGGAFAIAKILFWVFIALAVLFLVLSFTVYKKVT